MSPHTSSLKEVFPLYDYPLQNATTSKEAKLHCFRHLSSLSSTPQISFGFAGDSDRMVSEHHGPGRMPLLNDGHGHNEDSTSAGSTTMLVVISTLVAVFGSSVTGFASGYSAPSESGIRDDLGLSLAARVVHSQPDGKTRNRLFAMQIMGLLQYSGRQDGLP